MKTKLFSLLLTFVGLSTFCAQAQNINMVQRSTLSFPGQTIANVCGFAANGKEYALLGASKGLIIVDVTNPDVPVQIVQLPGPDNFWKEIKTYSHYAYVTSEGGQGIQVVDLSALPSPNVNNYFYTGDGAIQGQLNTIHALHIDVTKGYLYAYGSNLFNGGAVVFNLNADPYHPTYAGNFSELAYIHDGYVDNDTLFAGHIYDGIFSMVDMTDKSNPKILNTQSTPNNFTHNTWLSDDRKTIFTTDETADSYLASYDVSNPENITFLDKIQSNPGSKSIVHNTHILGNYAVTAWYKDGVTIVDTYRPNNLVQVGNFDSYPQGDGPGFDGCWGVYPYLPSGNLVVGNIEPGEMYMVTPVYQRAAYLEGLITNAANGNPISNAKIQFTGNPASVGFSNGQGSYAIGQLNAGNVEVTVYKLGFEPKTVQTNIVTAQVTNLNIQLTPLPEYTISGSVVKDTDGSPIANSKVSVISSETKFDTITDANGNFILPGVFLGNYEVVVGKWGYKYRYLPVQPINSNQQIEFELEAGYEDDFIFDYGWASTGSSQGGRWELAEPSPIDVGLPFLLAPDFDVDGDLGDLCFVTGNNSDQVDEDDVENGNSVLSSPSMDLSGYANPKITGKLWALSVNQLFQFPDTVKIYISNGVQNKLVTAIHAQTPDWIDISFHVKDYLPLGTAMRFVIIARDNPQGTVFDSFEAAFDQFKVTDQSVSTQSPEQTAYLNITPNPFLESTQVEFHALESNSTLQLFDMSGRTIQTIQLQGPDGVVSMGDNLEPGVYFVCIASEGVVKEVKKLVKVR